ncbi:MAG: hypothetical protein LBC96_07285 [Lachnospiraceae bacterium]|jgi:hypothetical protein|nr:hypothetical protein [Lachnospiraceae bacterium]
MKKWLVVTWALLLGGGLFFGQNLAVTATDATAEEGFITVQEAIEHAESFIETFHYIVVGGTEDQFATLWVYDSIIAWRNVLEEIGTYNGIKKSTATVDSERADIKVEINGSRRNAIVEMVLYFDAEPEIHIYSKFSFTTFMNESGAGNILTLFNTVAVLFIIGFLLIVIMPRLPLAGRSEGEFTQSVDGTIAQIIENEEKTETTAADTAEDVTAEKTDGNVDSEVETP